MLGRSRAPRSGEAQRDSPQVAGHLEHDRAMASRGWSQPDASGYVSDVWFGYLCGSFLVLTLFLFFVEMVNLRSLLGGQASQAPPPAPPADLQPGSEDAPLEVEAGRPRKKAKAAPSKGPEAGPSRGETGPSRRAAGKGPRPTSVRDLCRLPAGDGEPFQSRLVSEIPLGESSDPLVARWGGLSRGDRVWAGGDPSAAFLRGALHPDMARDLYVLPSEVLLNKSAQSLIWGLHYATALMDRVHDAGRVIGGLVNRNVELHRQVEEVRAGAGPEAVAAVEKRAAEFEAEAARLRSELEAAKKANEELQKTIRVERIELRLLKTEASALSKKLEEAKAETRAALEALAKEARLRPAKDKELLEAYKKSEGFELGLTRTGRVSFEYGYRVATSRFRARHPGLEVEEDPFAPHPEDLGVDMPEDVPFDDRLVVP
ncbi:uncharacterized protein LOC108951563 [Musa acuminata AAA Group]|uniref:uncharacterized protein LOC108951563 n=1 Tax=Musa acuminata AAA Group TaxID=214697 RepID=UPI0031D0BFC7